MYGCAWGLFLGVRWSAIATHLPKRTDNEIKNYWNTHLKKRLAKMGIDPVTHKPKSDALVSVDGQTKNAANLSHMAQWESARLEAEARLVRESKLRSAAAAAAAGAAASTSPSSASLHPHLGSSSSSAAAKPCQSLPCLDVLKAWQGVWSKTNKACSSIIPGIIPPTGHDLDSPTSTLSFSSDNTLSIFPTSTLALASSVSAASNKDSNNNNNNSTTMAAVATTSTIEFINSSSSSMCKEEVEEFNGYSENHKSRMENSMLPVHDVVGFSTDGFTDLLMGNTDEDGEDGDDDDDQNASDGSGSDNNNNNVNNSNGSDEDEAKNYWNNILNLVNSSPSESPLF